MTLELSRRQILTLAVGCLVGAGSLFAVLDGSDADGTGVIPGGRSPNDGGYGSGTYGSQGYGL